jgi:hypothetical protein
MTALRSIPQAEIACYALPLLHRGRQFSKVMIGQGRGDWYMCARCGHLTLLTDPLFECTCAKCIELKNRDPRTSRLNR